MKQKETYTVILNTYPITTNRTGNNTNLGYTFNVNWDSILPKIYNRFLVNFTFFSAAKSGFTESYSININFGTMNTFDHNSSRSNYLGLIHPYPISTSVFYAVANEADNAPVTINYPSNRFITVSINNTNTQNTVYLSSEYILTLQFTPLD